jgi:ribosomal protein S18 acetylase RimI-like enzyme
MPHRLHVRAATSADVDALVPLFEAYRAFYERAPDARSARDFLRHRLERGDSTILLAVDDAADARAVGFVQLYPVFSSLRMAPALILNDLFVDPSTRRLGVARLLMDAACAFARKSGAVSLQLETAQDNSRARALYESLGYRVEEGFLHYTLDVG